MKPYIKAARPVNKRQPARSALVERRDITSNEVLHIVIGFFIAIPIGLAIAALFILYIL